MLRRYLGTQGAFHIVTNAQIINCFLHILWLYLLVFYFDFGYEGVAYSTNITFFLNFILPCIYIRVNKSAIRENSWHWINKDSFVGLVEYMKFGIPTIIMTAFEFWSYEVINMLAGYLGTLELGASAILFNII